MLGTLRAALAVTILMLPSASCAHESAAISFPASRIGAAGVPHLSARQRNAVRAVLTASTAADRRRLIVSFPPDVWRNPPGTMVLFYGDPRHPDGITDNAREAYHVLGAGCNVFYYPSDGREVAVPGEGGAECKTWKESAADRVARRYGLGN